MRGQQVSSLLANVTLPDAIQPQVQPPTGPTGVDLSLYTEKQYPGRPGIKNDAGLGDRPPAPVRSGRGRYRQFRRPGVKTYEIRVDPGKLTNLGIPPSTSYSAVQKNNINIGGDFIVRNNQAYVVRGIGLLNDISEIRNIIVTNTNDIPVLVKDVAEVELSNVPRLGHVGRADRIEGSPDGTPAASPAGNSTIEDQDDVVEAIIIMRKGENPHGSYSR